MNTSTINISCTNCSVSSEKMSIHSQIVVAVELILMLIICGGNILTILAVYKTPKLQTVPNQYIVSLACADLLAGLILPYQAALHFPGIQQIFDNNKYLCLCRHVAFFISMGQTIQCITVIAIDRAIFIGFPLYYKTTSSIKKARMVIVFTWILAFIMGSLVLYVNNWVEGEGCLVFKIIPIYYQVHYQVTIFLLFSCINVFCYGFIFYVSKKHLKNRKQKLSEIELTVKSNNLKIVRMFVTVFGVYFVCMVPAFIAVTMAHTRGLPDGVVDITILFALLNSGMNFFIYAVRNQNFRRAFAQMLCCGKYKPSGSNYGASAVYLSRMSTRPTGISNDGFSNS